MASYNRDRVKDILRKYGRKIESKISTTQSGENYSNEYLEFKSEYSPELSRFEKLCNSLGSIIKLKLSEKDEVEISKHLKVAHLDLEPWKPLTLAVMAFLSVFFLGILISVGIVFLSALPGEGITDMFINHFPLLFFLLVAVLSLFLFYFVKGYPARLANQWRLKASSQMVPAILYVVVYMRHTPNLEKAIAFASEYLDRPLALDFKKIFYDVEVGKFSTIKESLDNYLESWRGYSSEFIEAFHLIEGSLFEPDNSRRVANLEKSLSVVLDGVYDKMLKFSHGVRTPLTNVYMLGVVLPTLGLALLPLASALLGGLLKSVHVFLLFNLIVPFLVFYLTDKVIFLRPGGHGETQLLERSPLYSEYKKKKHYFNAFVLCLPFLVLGLLPLIFHYTAVPEFLGVQKDYTFSQLGLGIFGDSQFFGFSEDGSGPFGIGALVLGLFIPLGIALFFSIAYQDKTRDLIVERRNTRELEAEFNNSLFQLGNRIGSGTPPELAFGRVAESSKGLRTEDFFRRVNYNVARGGMGVEKAIFDPKRGAIISYPSQLIATSMRILVESAKKGLKIAATSLMSISEYVKNIKKITQRLQDLLAEVASDMKSNMTFLAPLLSGVVVGLAAMISFILGKLQNIGDLAQLGISGGFGNFIELFDFTQMIPPYYLQIAVGIYIIQVIFILTRTLVTVDLGQDKLEKINQTGKNLKTGILLFFLTALISSFVLFVLSVVVLGNIGA